jgi:DNA-binding NarL/FixJ family response regulator
MGDRRNNPLDDEARANTPSVEAAQASEEIEGVSAKVGGFIAVVGGRPFLRECIRSMESAFSLPLVACSSVSDIGSQRDQASAELVILSLTEGSNEASSALKALTELLPGVPVLVLASANDVDLARTAIRHGAKGYVPLRMGFETAIAAARFVLAGRPRAPMVDNPEGTDSGLRQIRASVNDSDREG